jgi:hypothetical protein
MSAPPRAREAKAKLNVRLGSLIPPPRRPLAGIERDGDRLSHSSCRFSRRCAQFPASWIVTSRVTPLPGFVGAGGRHFQFHRQDPILLVLRSSVSLCIAHQTPDGLAAMRLSRPLPFDRPRCPRHCALSFIKRVLNGIPAWCAACLL